MNQLFQIQSINMKVNTFQFKAEELGPLIYRTKDDVTHFYRYYCPMQRMGDEHHNLHLVLDEFHSVEVKIKEFLVDNLSIQEKEACLMNLQQQMSLIESKDKEKWNEFRFELRKSGYII